MRIKVKLGDPLWRNIGQRQIELQFADEPATVARAVGELLSRYPALADDLRADGTGRREGLPCHLFLNRQKIAWDQARQTTLRDGDQLALFLHVVGG